MTRRFEKGLENLEGVNEEDLFFIIVDGRMEVHIYDDKPGIEVIKSRYKIGDVVAVKQSYKDAGYVSDTIQEGRALRKSVHSEDWDDSMIGKLGEWYIDQLAGWNNKMFTHPEMMPHHIRITDIKVERMQEISNEDCLKEGVIHYDDIIGEGYMLAEPYNNSYRRHCFTTPRKAFAALIDKVSGKGTWEKNPWVFAYSFELID